MTEHVDSTATTPWWRRRTTLIVAGAVVVVAVIAIVVAVFVSRGGTPSASPSPTDSATGTASPSPSVTPDASAGPSPTETADAGPFPELPPVAPDEPSETDAATVQIAKVEHVDGEAVAPGDVAGAAIRLTIDITNTGTQPLDLGLVVVNGYMGPSLDPAEIFTKPGGSPVSGSLAPGQKATGVYLFRVPIDRQNDVTIVVDYLPGQPAIVFKGSFA
ncbi:hypothetical protein [Microbacterium sp.]|uniref:hypothetical protein n=1 Tax=Microbacterium sp. TaxID=51671 RepID=UPI003F6FE2D2